MFTEPDIIFDYIYPRIKGNIIRSPELNKLYNFFKKVEVIQYEELSESFSEEKFSSQYELLYTSETIKKKIKEYNLKYSYQLRFNNSLIDINIFTSEKITNDIFISELKRYIQFILSIHPVDVNITINYHLSPDKKYMKNKIPTTNDVNSGSCTITNEGSIINIWRKEEILKVTLHEIFHALEHGDYRDNQYIIDYFKDKYNITSTKLNTHEAYTEIWANLINCFLISQKYNKGNKNIFNKLVTIEKYFSIFQAQKIMYHSLDKIINIDKHTNVTSYFLIRAELYQELNKFLKFCRLRNKNYIEIKDTQKWLTFLESKKKIKKNNIIFNKGHRNYLFKNLRMTILELNVLN